ncbi:MAG: ankyrin repeat domain-containing protein [Rhodoferax sp.]|nr:ankyrin repeat domain-containing protein [Rhodoferax sp.]
MRRAAFPAIVGILWALFLSCAAHAGSYEDFFRALERNHAVVVKSLLARGFDPNTVDPTGVPGLLVAIKNQSSDAAQVLLEHPAIRIEARNVHGESALMLAALDGNLPLCRALVERDADVNKPGWTPLHYAASRGHITVMDFLLSQYAYIDAASPNGTTPLMMAAQYGNQNAVELLLRAGADATLRNSVGLNALDFARMGGNEVSIRLLSKALGVAAPIPEPRGLFIF